MNRKILFIFMLSFLSLPVFAAKNQDLSELKEKYKDLYSKEKSSSASNKINELSLEPPKSRFIDNTPPSLTPEDKRHVQYHMKLANRYFSKKNYEKAQEEVNTVFERDPSNSGGHFMLAVISGRKKDYKTAWYHINIAKEKDSNYSKIDDFIKKLKTVSSEPENPEWISGIYNGIQTNASDRTFDLIEKLFREECSQNVTTLTSTEYKSEMGDSSSTELVFKARDQFDPDKIVLELRKYNPAGAAVIDTSNNNLQIKLTYKGLKPEKTDAKPINGINDFINDLIEEFPEVAISNTDESEPKRGLQEITYEISARDFTSINKFIRKISPYSIKYILQNMDLAYIPGSQSTIWKAKIKVVYKL